MGAEQQPPIATAPIVGSARAAPIEFTPAAPAHRTAQMAGPVGTMTTTDTASVFAGAGPGAVELILAGVVHDSRPPGT